MEKIVSAEIISDVTLAELVRGEILSFRPKFSNVGIDINAAADAFGFIRKYHVFIKTGEGRNLTGKLRTIENEEVNAILVTLKSRLPVDYVALDPNRIDLDEGPMQYIQIVIKEST